MIKRRGTVFMFALGAAVLTMASAAFACVTFTGKVEFRGHDGTTEVVGTGNSHGYCSDGRPTTAAAGHLDDPITIKAKPGSCGDEGAFANHQLPEGTYEVRFNNEPAYTYDGTYWNMFPQLGCFHPSNQDTSSIIGSFYIDATGNGSWTGSFGLDDLKGAPAFATPLTASNMCIGAPSLPNTGFPGGKPGILAPYQLLAI